jgi:iron complex outermembrane receptor protein
MTVVPSRRARSLVFALSVSTSLYALAPAARAQSVDASAEPADTIETVTVVARKRAEDNQQVPIPVTVISSNDLEKQDLENISEFQTKLPAVSVYLTNPKQLNIGIRGIGNNGFNTDGIDASVGVFIDGVYTGRPGMVSNDFSDIDQVELLRGPQGTLFGKNTTAGAVLINSKLPSFAPELTAEATMGDYNLREFKIDGTGPIPILDDKVAVRLSAYYNDMSGTYPNLSGGRAQNGREGDGVRLQFLAQPMANLTSRLIIAHTDQNFPTITPVTLSIYSPTALQARMAAAGQSLLVSNADQREVNINGTQNATTRSNMFSLQNDLDLGDNGSITSITAYMGWSCHTNNDNDYTQLDALTDYGSCNTERQFSQELRWASPTGGAVEWVAGGFLSRQQLEVDSRVQFGTQYDIWAANPSATAFPNIGTRTWANGAYVSKLTGAGFSSRADFHAGTQAIFANATWHPDDAKRWSLNIGVRQTFEDKNYSYLGVVSSNPGGLTTGQLLALSPSGANAQLGSATDAVMDNSFSGQLGVNYQITDDVMAYVTGSRGHKSKGFNLLPENATNPDSGVASAIAHGATQDIAGERADNVELGMKSVWFEHHFLLNLTAFDTEVHNYQANESIGVGNTATKFLANVGALRSAGVELESEAWLFEGFHLKGVLAYDEAKYASFPNSVCPAESTALSCDLTGRQVAWAPKWTGDITADYTRDVTEDVAAYGIADLNYRSSQNTTITLDPLAVIPSHTLTNLRIGAVLKPYNLDLQFWVENLFDNGYYINLLGLTKSTGIVQGYPGNPRTYGVTVRATF